MIAPKANNAASKSHMTIRAMADVRVAARLASRVCGESAGTGLSVIQRDNHTAALTWAVGGTCQAQLYVLIVHGLDVILIGGIAARA